jgi:predicted peptidase
VFESLIIENVALVQGQNSVKVTALTNSFPNFDCLIVHTNIELEYDDSEPVDSVYEGEVSFKLIVGAHPGGPAVEKAILHFEDQVSSDLLEGETFVISHSAPGWGGNTQVTKMNASNAYLSDADGAEIQGSESNYVTVEYSVQYGTYSFLANNSAFVYNFTSSLNAWIDEATLAVSINSGKTVKIDGVEYNQLLAEKVTFDEFVVPSLENWKLDGTHTYEDDEYGEITLKYAAYEPESLSGDQKNPLIIWLHGAGEGGTDPTIVLLGNEVTYLANDEIQSYFTSGSQTGAYILAVQSPTMWMDNGTGQYGDGSTSKYTDALWSTIRAYVQDNGDIDETRIYVGGCSNGGFMTMNMLITDTEDFFAAAFPICQAYNYSKIDAETKEKLAQKAIWFTHAANDPTVDPNSYTNKLYVDLINAGAENVYYSYFEDVTYDGTSYDGHWSWIYTLRNECKNIQPTQAEEGDLTVSDLDPTSTLTHDTYETLWAWMAAQQNTK